MPLTALLEAMLVVLIWSTSPPLLKIVLGELSNFELVAVRFVCAALVLLPLVLTRSRQKLARLSWRGWVRLGLMGVLGYTLGNGLLYIGLRTLSATSIAFLLNAIPLITVVVGIFWLQEWPSRRQVVGMGVALLGGLIFFGLDIQLSDLKAIAISLAGVFATALQGILGREFARDLEVDSVALTAVPMAIGGGLLLAVDPPNAIPSNRTLLILVWLILGGSVLGFVLWNHALQRLQAFEISVVGNLLPMGTALWAPLFIGEVVNERAWLGMLVALAGVILVALGGERNLIGIRRRPVP